MNPVRTSVCLAIKHATMIALWDNYSNKKNGLFASRSVLLLAMDYLKVLLLSLTTVRKHFLLASVSVLNT